MEDDEGAFPNGPRGGCVVRALPDTADPGDLRPGRRSAGEIRHHRDIAERRVGDRCGPAAGSRRPRKRETLPPHQDRRGICRVCEPRVMDGHGSPHLWWGTGTGGRNVRNSRPPRRHCPVCRAWNAEGNTLPHRTFGGPPGRAAPQEDRPPQGHIPRHTRDGGPPGRGGGVSPARLRATVPRARLDRLEKPGPQEVSVTGPATRTRCRWSPRPRTKRHSRRRYWVSARPWSPARGTRSTW